MQGRQLVSLLIISYRHKKFIEDCFESILTQTYTNLEILYLDDASDDGTFEKAYEYQRKFEEKFRKVIFLKNNSNLGLVKSLNKLIGVCNGGYVKFLAADDFLFPDSVESLANFLYEYPQHDMVYSNGVEGNEDTHFPIDSVNNLGCVYQDNQPSGKLLFEELYARDFILAPGIMVRKTVYEKIGLYDENLGIEDWDFFLRIASEGSIGYLNEITVMYRQLKNSLSHSSNPERRINMKKSELMILEKYKDLAKRSKERMECSLNEALSDSYHIGNDEYIIYLYSYAKTNRLRITMRNKLKHMLYSLKVIKLFDSFLLRGQG